MGPIAAVGHRGFHIFAFYGNHPRRILVENLWQVQLRESIGEALRPGQSSTRDVAQIDERLTFEETLPDKTHGIFDHRPLHRELRRVSGGPDGQPRCSKAVCRDFG